MSKEVHAVFMLLGPASRLSKGKVRLRFVDRLINKDTEEEKNVKVAFQVAASFRCCRNYRAVYVHA